MQVMHKLPHLILYIFCSTTFLVVFARVPIFNITLHSGYPQGLQQLL